MKIRGIVMSIDPEKRTMLVATRDRDFKRVPLPGRPVQVGEEVEVELAQPVPSKIAPKPGHRRPAVAGSGPARRRLHYLGLVAAVLLLALVGLYTNQLFFAEPTYIAMDINPSLELAVDSSLRVVELIPRNPDGVRLLSGLKNNAIKGKPFFEEIIEQIILEAVKLGYLKKNGSYENNIIVATIISSTPRPGLKLPFFKKSVSSSRGEPPARDRQPSPAQVENIITAKLVSAQIESRLVMGETTRENRRQALAKGLSVNQYLVYLRSAAENKNLPPVSTLKGLSLKDTIKVLPGKSTLLPPGKIIRSSTKTINKSGPAGQSPGRKNQEKNKKKYERENENIKGPVRRPVSSNKRNEKNKGQGRSDAVPGSQNKESGTESGKSGIRDKESNINDSEKDYGNWKNSVGNSESSLKTGTNTSEHYGTTSTNNAKNPQKNYPDNNLKNTESDTGGNAGNNTGDNTDSNSKSSTKNDNGIDTEYNAGDDTESDVERSTKERSTKGRSTENNAETGENDIDHNEIVHESDAEDDTGDENIPKFKP